MRILRKKRGVTGPSFGYTNHDRHKIKIEHDIIDKPVKLDILNEIPPQVNEIPAHFIHEIKTKGYDVIGVNVFLRTLMRILRKKRGVTGPSFGYTNHDRHKIKIEHDIIDKPVKLDILNEIPPQVNEIPAHFIHEIKTKGYDVIGVIVFLRTLMRILRKKGA